ncbi:MAG TPA: hypothetical protein VF950_02125 [Planctomycetota bacterium]
MIKGVVLALVVCVAGAQAKSIKDVMAAHKGKESMLNKITSGKGTDEDHKKLLELYEFMATQKPPQGDEKSWKDKSAALVAVAKDVVAKKEGALDALKKASDCKACHEVHKPKK